MDAEFKIRKYRFIERFINSVDEKNLHLYEKLLDKTEKKYDCSVDLFEKKFNVKIENFRILTQEDCEEFKNNYKKIAPIFIKNLDTDFSHFTISEKRYIMLANLKLSNKQISQILGVSEVTIRVTWNRIKNKISYLNIENIVDLLKYINKI